MNPLLLESIDKKTTEMEKHVKKAKKKMKKHSRSGIFAAIILIAFLSAYMTVKGLLFLNTWYENNKIVTHSFITITFHKPVSFEKRVIITPVKEVSKSATLKPNRFCYNEETGIVGPCK